MTLKHPKIAQPGPVLAVAPHFNLETQTIPRHGLPDGELPPEVAYQIIHDELMLDGNARLNVATFVKALPADQLPAAVRHAERRVKTERATASDTFADRLERRLERIGARVCRFRRRRSRRR